MPEIISVGETPVVLDASVEKIAALQVMASRLEAINVIAAQYVMFVNALTEFKKKTFSSGVDFHLLREDDFRFDSSFLLQAENSLMHATASVVKFLELLPSMVDKCYPNTKRGSETKEKLSNLYDSKDGNYIFICELRNAIVHQRVPINVRKNRPNDSGTDSNISFFGYFINFDEFIERCVDKKHKRDKLSICKPILTDGYGQVDVIGLFSKVASAVYDAVIRDLAKDLKALLNNITTSMINYVVDNSMLPADCVEDGLLIYDGETLYSSIHIGRTYRLIDKMHRPIFVTSISICPSVFK